MDFALSKQTEHLAQAMTTVPSLLIATTASALLESLLELLALARVLANILSHAELREPASLRILSPRVEPVDTDRPSVWPPTFAAETLKPLLTECVLPFLLL